jgi:hypothetical protein
MHRYTHPTSRLADISNLRQILNIFEMQLAHGYVASLRSLQVVRWMFKSECMRTSTCERIHSSAEPVQFRSRIRLWVCQSFIRTDQRGACGRCFRIQGYQDPYNPLTKLNTPSIVVKITDCCPVAGNVLSFRNFINLRQYAINLLQNR